MIDSCVAALCRTWHSGWRLEESRIRDPDTYTAASVCMLGGGKIYITCLFVTSAMNLYILHFQYLSITSNTSSDKTSIHHMYCKLVIIGNKTKFHTRFRIPEKSMIIIEAGPT